jgi:hypothetical protein
MTPKVSPYSGDYVIYVYEFPDGYVYVGLTFKEVERRRQHEHVGPVFEHAKICLPVYRVLQSGIRTPAEAAEAEIRWLDSYRSSGWKLLNDAPAGGLGSARLKWTPDALLKDAMKFSSRKAWYLGSQGAYAMAKKLGCFEECVAHMPRYDKSKRTWASPSDEARGKMRAAKLGRTLSQGHKDDISRSVRRSWAERRRGSEGEASSGEDPCRSSA